MIHVLHGRRRNSALLDQMFHDRKTLFVDLLGWELALDAIGREIDQYDHDRALYVVVTDATGAHAASLRLLPTDQSHLLADLFPGLCAAGIPSGPGIYEVTRLCACPPATVPRSGSSCAIGCSRQRSTMRWRQASTI